MVNISASLCIFKRPNPNNSHSACTESVSWIYGKKSSDVTRSSYPATAGWHSDRKCPMNVVESSNLVHSIIRRKSSNWQRFPEHDSNQHRHPAISDDIDLLLYCLLLPSSIVVFMKDSRSSFTFNCQQQCKRLKIIQTQISIRTWNTMDPIFTKYTIKHTILRKWQNNKNYTRSTFILFMNKLIPCDIKPRVTQKPFV